MNIPKVYACAIPWTRTINASPQTKLVDSSSVHVLSRTILLFLFCFAFPFISNAQEAALSKILADHYPAARDRDRAYLSVSFTSDVSRASPVRALASPGSANASASITQEINKLQALKEQIKPPTSQGKLWLGGVFPGASPEVMNAIDSAVAALQHTRTAIEFAAAQPDPAEIATSALPQSGLSGIPIQKDTYLVLLRPNATAPQIDDVLSRYKLRVVSGAVEIGLLVLQRDTVVNSQPNSAAAISISESQKAVAPGAEIEKEMVAKLRNEPIIASAALNIPLSPTILPSPSQTAGFDIEGKAFSWDWREGPGTPESTSSDGNWGLKAVRFPAAWNFADAIRRRGQSKVKVGIVDVGFSAHEDLDFAVSGIASGSPKDHGNHVAGIVGARWGNGIGVDGACPYADLHVTSAPELTVAQATLPTITPVFSEVIATLVEFITSDLGIKAINISLAYNWVPNYSRNPNSDQELQDIARDQGIIVRTVAELAARKGIIIVSAAGNDSSARYPNVRAQYASPFNWAAANAGIYPLPASNIIVVESVGREGARSFFSNVNGQVSAPGEGILSTVAFANSQPSKKAYAVMSGTSMAAPHVTGLICLLYAYNPDLTMARTLEIVRNTASHDVSAAPRIDAFAAMLEARDDSLTDLADLNSDGKVDMADFQIFKAAIERLKTLTPAEQVDGNNCPRTNLNGSGHLSSDPKDRRLVKGEQMSDLDVMMRAWTDTTVSASSLPGLLP
jgi:subtilisin family serine protease